jgi:hypothetical protein
MPYKKHSYKDIMKVLTILISCGYNYGAAQAITRIDRHTIMRWHKKYKDNMPVPPKIRRPVKKNLPKKADMTLDERKLEYEKNLFEAKDEILYTILKVTKGMRNVKYLAESLKIVTDLEKGNSSTPVKSGEVRPNLLQTIMKNIEKIEINNNTQILNTNGTEND